MSTVAEWVEKAEGDYHSTVSLHRLRSNPEPDNVCFLSQQCAEKYLKAFLVDRGINPPHIHDLVGLLNQCEVYEPLCRP